MGLKKILPFLAISVLSVAAVFGVVTYQKVSAQAPEPTPTATTTPTQPQQSQKGPGFMGGKVGEATDQYLADALGITTDQLSTAYQTATTEALKQAVADGKLTQAQADQLAARANGHIDGRWLNDANIDFNALLAKALNISVDQLNSAQQKAFDARIDAAVTAGNMTQAQADLMKGRYALGNSTQFQSSMQSAFEAAVNQAVQSGVITQAQEDQILQNAADMGSRGLDGFGGGFGGFGGPRGRGGHGGWFGPANPGTTTAPTGPSF
jgi:hypothetical protein